jgi:hypothetical protein
MIPRCSLGDACSFGLAERARGAKAELAEILERRPNLQGKSLEAVKRILRREARLSLRFRRTSNT